MARTLLGKLKRGLFMTHTEFLEKAGETFRRDGPVAPANLDRLEEALIASDAGVELSLRLVDALREEISASRITTAGELRPAIREQLLSLLREAEAAQPAVGVSEKPHVTLLVGVNGTGKTTTAAKLAKRRHEAGSSVILAAADTFRAAAVDQLKVWAERVGAPVVHQQEGADPAAVVFDSTPSPLRAPRRSTRSSWIRPDASTRAPI
jgi:fused signal recognition particle receptor